MNDQQGAAATGSNAMIRKLVFSSLGLALLISSGISFHRSRHRAEAVVLSEGVTEVRRLSDYHDCVAGSVNDCNVYIIDSGKPGATMFIMGGSHPEEPAGRLAAWPLA